MMDIFDVDYRQSMVREAAARYVERRTIEIWEQFFTELESGVPDGVDLDALRSLYDWAFRQYWESRNVIGAMEASQERQMPCSVTEDEVTHAQLVNPRAYKLAARIVELVPAVADGIEDRL